MNIAQINELAERYGFGEACIRFYANPTEIFTAAGTFTVLNLLPLFITLNGQWAWGLLLPAAFFIWGIWKMRQPRLVLYQNGFIFIETPSKSSVEVCSCWYYELQTICQDCYTRYKIYLPIPIPIPVEIKTSFFIRTTNTSFTLDESVWNARKAGDFLQKILAQYQIEEEITNFNHGNTLKFGILNMNHRGIWLTQEDFPPLSWENLGKLEIHNGILIIEKSNSQHQIWAQIKIYQITNFYLLLEMIGRVRQNMANNH